MDLYLHIANIVLKVLIYLTSIINILTLGIFVTIKKPLLIHYYKLKSTHYSDSFILSNDLHLVWDLKDIILHLVICFCGLVWAVTVSHIFLFFMTLAVLSTGQIFCRMSPSFHFSDVFLMNRLWLWIWGKNATEVKYCSHHILSRLHTMNMISHCWFNCGPGWGSVEVSPLWSYSVSLLFHGSLCVQPHWGFESYASSSWQWNVYIYYLEFHIRYLSILSHLFILSFVVIRKE